MKTSSIPSKMLSNHFRYRQLLLFTCLHWSYVPKLRIFRKKILAWRRRHFIKLTLNRSIRVFFYSLAFTGSYAIRLSGSNILVRQCDIHDTDGGVGISGEWPNHNTEGEMKSPAYVRHKRNDAWIFGSVGVTANANPFFLIIMDFRNWFRSTHRFGFENAVLWSLAESDARVWCNLSAFYTMNVDNRTMSKCR